MLMAIQTKAVLNVEYTIEASEFCAKANAMNFNSIKKDFSLEEEPVTFCN